MYQPFVQVSSTDDVSDADHKKWLVSEKKCSALPFVGMSEVSHGMFSKDRFHCVTKSLPSSSSTTATFICNAEV